MGSRLELQYLLEGIIGTENVYYNPPENIDMSYPAIRYETSAINLMHANNSLYKATICYNITIINELPNDSNIQKILSLPMCSFDRHYVYDGLNHDVLKLYY